MKVSNGKVTAEDVRGKRAIRVQDKTAARWYQGNIVGGSVARQCLIVAYERIVGGPTNPYSGKIHTTEPIDKDAAHRLELA